MTQIMGPSREWMVILWESGRFWQIFTRECIFCRKFLADFYKITIFLADSYKIFIQSRLGGINVSG